MYYNIIVKVRKFYTYHIIRRAVMNRVKKAAAVITAVIILVCSLAVSSSAAGRKNYLLLGDSIAYGQGLANSQDACYGKIVADTNGYNYTNYAVDGYTSSALLKYLDVDFVSAGVRNADIISLSIGGNDFLTSNMLTLLIGGKMGIDTQFDRIEAEFSQNFAGIISKIKSLNSRAVILVQTVYNPSKFFFRDVYQKGVNVINGVIRGYLSSHPGAYVTVDVESAFAGHARDYIAIDTIHPNVQGNLVIAKLVLQKLYALGLGSSTEPVVQNPGIDWAGTSSTSFSGMISYFMKLFSKYMSILFE